MCGLCSRTTSDFSGLLCSDFLLPRMDVGMMMAGEESMMRGSLMMCWKVIFGARLTMYFYDEAVSLSRK